GPDLQRARERPRSLAEQLRDLAEHLVAADLAERDAPLGVVVLRRHVVVAAVDVEDLVGSGGRGHRAAESRRAPTPRSQLAGAAPCPGAAAGPDATSRRPPSGRACSCAPPSRGRARPASASSPRAPETP